MFSAEVGQAMGKASRDKGARNERAAVRFLQSHGLVAARVAGSGGFASRATSPKMREALTGDVVVECDRGDLRIEVKARKSLPAYLTGGAAWLRDGVRLTTSGSGAGILRKYANGGEVPVVAHFEINRLAPAYLQSWLAQSPDGIVMMRETRPGHSGDWVFAFTREGLGRLVAPRDHQ